MTKSTLTVWCYSLTHGMVDMYSAVVVYNAALIHNVTPARATVFIILYDLIAFAAQPMAGFYIDFSNKARFCELTGILLIISGIISVSTDAFVGIIAVGTGNALFHLGAGSQILFRYPGTTSKIGIFAGPGALGLNIGLCFGTQGYFPIWTMTICLIAAFIGLSFLPELKILHRNLAKEGSCKSNSYPGVVLVLLSAISIRGFIGQVGFTGLQSNSFVIMGFGFAACAGKMIGGNIADKFGWGTTAIITSLLSCIMIVFVHDFIGIAFVTMMMLQMTMPITLASTYAALSERPAFAFGLTCLSLVIGTLSAFYLPRNFLHLPVIMIMIAGSGIFIVVALLRMRYLNTRINYALFSQDSST